jgi:preprotein translocase SecE subunit
VADEKDTKKVRRIKKVESVRQRAEKAGVEKKPRRITKTAGTVVKPIKAVHRIGQKEYYLPLPQNKVGKFLNKRRKLFPRFFINAWRELRGVTWPSARETFRLTVAVLMFAIIFGVLIAGVDYALDKAFKQLLLK